MEVSSFFRAWLRNSKTFVSPCTVASYGLHLGWSPDCKPEPRLKESIGLTRVAGRAWLAERRRTRVAGCAPKQRLLCEFGDGGREQTRRRLAGIERGGQCRFGFGQALPATSADAQFPGEIAQAARAAFDGGSALSA